jgi:hypothetical protein
MSAEEIPAYEALQRQNRPHRSVSGNDRAMIVTLSFAYIEPRHRFRPAERRADEQDRRCTKPVL